MYCYNCGTKIDDDSKFCYNCGAKVEENNVNPSNDFSKAATDFKQNISEKLDKYKDEVVSINNSMANVIKYFAICCAVLLGFQGFLDLFGSVFYILGSMLNNGILEGVFFNIFNIAAYFASSVTLVAFAGLLAIYGLKRTNENSSSLFVGLSVTFLICIVAQIFALVMDIDRNCFNYILFTLGITIILFIILFVSGDKTLLTINYGLSSEVIIHKIKSDYIAVFEEFNNQYEKHQNNKLMNMAANDINQSFPNPINPGVQSPSVMVGNTIINTNKNIFVVIILSLLTCGLYYYWMVYTVARDINTICNDGDKTGGLIAFILLSFVTCGLYAIYWEYKAMNRMNAYAPTLGITLSDTGTSILLWYVVGILICGLGQYVALHIILSNLNRLAKAYNALVMANAQQN